MSLHYLPSVSKQNSLALFEHSLDRLCSVCNQPVPLESSNTDERGLAVHERCYVLELRLQRVSSPTFGPSSLVPEAQ